MADLDIIKELLSIDASDFTTVAPPKVLPPSTSSQTTTSVITSTQPSKTSLNEWANLIDPRLITTSTSSWSTLATQTGNTATNGTVLVTSEEPAKQSHSLLVLLLVTANALIILGVLVFAALKCYKRMTSADSQADSSESSSNTTELKNIECRITISPDTESAFVSEGRSHNSNGSLQFSNNSSCVKPTLSSGSNVSDNQDSLSNSTNKGVPNVEFLPAHTNNTTFDDPTSVLASDGLYANHPMRCGGGHHPQIQNGGLRVKGLTLARAKGLKGRPSGDNTIYTELAVTTSRQQLQHEDPWQDRQDGTTAADYAPVSDTTLSPASEASTQKPYSLHYLPTFPQQPIISEEREETALHPTQSNHVISCPSPHRNYEPLEEKDSRLSDTGSYAASKESSRSRVRNSRVMEAKFSRSKVSEPKRNKTTPLYANSVQAAGFYSDLQNERSANVYGPTPAQLKGTAFSPRSAAIPIKMPIVPEEGRETPQHDERELIELKRSQQSDNSSGPAEDQTLKPGQQHLKQEQSSAAPAADIISGRHRSNAEDGSTNGTYARQAKAGQAHLPARHRHNATPSSSSSHATAASEEHAAAASADDRDDPALAKTPTELINRGNEIRRNTQARDEPGHTLIFSEQL